ncbi:nucleotide exchange factor GrpE [Pseudodesulfovibrio tunisiensis]|uniref:nucleotide exchange factor GrpE n=1 Tax=Pseudodesulfovibrio tunisiensis TaxID=463192 RepID=UPI001FB1F0D2|nr:nucleotide exchange factor GrpE [Pseudodesulfovibrio tunisiensis]
MAKQTKDTEVPINGIDEEPLFGGEAGQEGDAPVEEAEAGETQKMDLSQEELEVLCRENVCPNCEREQEAAQMRLRVLADSENLRKRLMRETEEMKKFAAESVLADLLPVLDNLDLALAHTGSLDGACKNFVVGVDMTRKIFLDTLKGHGLELVETTRGTEFNPEFHDAVGTAQDQELADNTVTQMVQAGYVLKGRLLRPAKVMVNKLS